MELLGILICSFIILAFIVMRVISYRKKHIKEISIEEHKEEKPKYSLKDYEKIIYKLKPKEEKKWIVEYHAPQPPKEEHHELNTPHQEKQEEHFDIRYGILTSEIFKKKD